MKISNAADALPSPSFEDPLSMLIACHEKVRHFAALALRLGDHVAERGADAEAAQAASSILRYFDTAAPLHHADEEDDVFPALRALQDPALEHAINELEGDHSDLASLWQSIHPWLVAVAQQEQAALPNSLGAFAERYIAHADREEAELYTGMAHFPEPVLAAIGRSMRARRGASET